MEIKTVVKKNGTVEPFAAEKLNQWAEWACENTNCQWSLLLTNAIKKMYDGIPTKLLQRCLIDTAEDLLLVDMDYAKVAARLALADIRKEALGGFEPPSLKEFYHDMVEKRIWEEMPYNEADLDLLGEVIKHERDETLPYSGIKQMSDKYLIRSIQTDQIHETPQFMYMGMAMYAFRGEPIKDIIGLYELFSTQKVNVPTPVLVGLRTGDNGFASCCLITSADTKESINAAANVAYTMTANRAGIGIELATRSPGDPIKSGRFKHGGKLAYYKLIDRTVKANTQQSRGGSATMQFAMFDPEIETLLRLKSQRVSDEMRIDTMDYSLAVSDYLLRRCIKQEQLMLVSSYHAPKLHELFYSKDVDGFIAEYERVEQDASVKKSFVPGIEVITAFMKERLDTARIYAHRVDEANKRSTFKDPIRISNLCQEILLPVKGYTDVQNLYDPETEDGEVALCNLAGICVGRVTDRQYERTAYLILKMVDNIITLQDYPYPNMRMTALARRSAGIGLINVANALAKKGLSYSSVEGRNFIHEAAERHSFWLHKASVKLAKEKGKCDWFDRTTYSDGTLLIDNYVQAVDEHHTTSLKLDWEGLRADILEHGMRNSVLEAHMPSESSSVAIGATNGLEPVRELLIYKDTTTGQVPFVVPDYNRLKDKYELAYDVANEDYVKFIAIVQKFTGQSISYNEYYDYRKYPNEVIPMKTLLKNFYFAAKLGIKTYYYLNTNVDNGGAAGQGCESGACSL